MRSELSVKASTALDATPERVWQALTDPEDIRQYMFGTRTEGEWEVGSTLTYSGMWNDKPYTDVGKITALIPNVSLHTQYYSPLSGKPDVPDSYANVHYDISEADGKTILTITQDNIEDEAAQKYMEGNWAMVLDSLKKLVETN